MRPSTSQPNIDARSQARTLKSLLPHLWPRDYPALRLRVAIAILLMICAKLVLVCVPFLYKAAVDSLTIQGSMVLTVPLLVIVSYGLARVGSQGFGELRDAVFAKVGQHAMRQIALGTFAHLHRLSLRFHLERRTGGLSRVIERGTKGIDFLLRFMVFNILPTILELIFVVVILLWRYP